jgi:hypothetical protein
MSSAKVCEGKTKTGKSCTRKAEYGQKFCFQHRSGGKSPAPTVKKAVLENEIKEKTSELQQHMDRIKVLRKELKDLKQKLQKSSGDERLFFDLTDDDSNFSYITVGNKKYSIGDSFEYDGKESIIAWFKIEVDEEFLEKEGHKLGKYDVEDDILVGYEYSSANIFKALKIRDFVDCESLLHYSGNDNIPTKLKTFDIFQYNSVGIEIKDGENGHYILSFHGEEP